MPVPKWMVGAPRTSIPSKGVKSLMTALNIVYDEKEERGFIKRKLTTLSFTLAGFLAAILSLLLIVGISALVEHLGLPGWLEALISLVRWPVLAFIFIAGLALAYRYGPSREDARFRWVSVGALVVGGGRVVVGGRSTTMGSTPGSDRPTRAPPTP